MTPEKLLHQSHSLALKISREHFTRLIGEFTGFLENYKSILVLLKSHQDRKVSGQNDWQAVGKTLINQFENIRRLVQTPEIDSEAIAKAALVSWNEEFEKILLEYPEIIEQEIIENLWQLQNEDNFNHRLRKKLFFLQVSIKSTVNSLGRIGRNVLGRAVQPAQVPRRTFNLHNFLRLHLGPPTANIFIKQFQALNDKISENIQELRHITDRIGDDLLPLSFFHPANFDQQTNTVISENPGIKDQIQNVTELIERVKSWDKTLEELFESKFSSIESHIKYLWPLSGTAICPDRIFNRNKVLRQQQRFEKQQTNLFENGRNQIQGQSGEWQKDLELSLLQFRCAHICLETLSLLRDNAIVKIQANITDAKNLIESMNDQLSADQVASDLEKLKSTLDDSQKLIDILRHDKLPQIMDTVHQADIEQIYNDYLSEVVSAAEMLSDSYLLFQANDTDPPSPTSSIETVKLKAIVLDDLLSEIKDSHSSHLSDIQSVIQQAMRIVSEIDQIVEFNIEASIKYLGENEGSEALEKSHRMAAEGLQRAQDRLDEVGDKFQEISSLADSSLKAITFDLLQKLQELADTKKIFEIKIRLAKSIAREKFRQTQRTIINKIISFGYLRSAIYKFYTKVSTGFKRARDYTEIKQSDSSADAQISTLLRESHQKVSHLPYVYQRLFSLAPLSDSRFFAGRLSELETINSEFETWKAKGCISVAMVGERGSGKTTLLNFANSQVFKDFPMVKIELTKTVKSEAALVELLQAAFGEPDIHSMDQLERILAESEQRKICVFENLHDLFLRTVDGFEALERFLLFIYKTQDRIFWLVTSGLYGWQYLDKVLNLSNHFQRIIKLGTLSKEEVTEIITKRHRVSGYDLEIEVNDDFRRTKTYRKLATDKARQQYLMEQLFEHLALFSSGNIRVAMQFWLATIKDFSGEKLTLSAGMELKLDFVKQLPDKELFTFAALIQHEALSAEEHAQVFRRDVNYSEILLDKMLNIGLLQKNAVGYQVHPFIYRTAVNALKEKNIFH